MKSIKKLLRDMGFRSKNKGTCYIEEMAQKGIHGILPLVEKGYTKVAEEHGVTLVSVERAIRYAMEQALYREGLDKWSKELGIPLYGELLCGELISILAERVEMGERSEVGKVLMGLGIYPNLLGYHYLCDVRTLSMEVIDRRQLCKDVYLHVAKANGTTPECVARAIRQAIDKGVERSPKSALEDFMGYRLFDKRITNRRFLEILLNR